MRKHIWKTLVAFTGAVAMAGCLGGAPTGPGAGDPGGDPGAGGYSMCREISNNSHGIHMPARCAYLG